MYDSVLIYSDANIIKMWNIQENKEIRVLGKHDGYVYCFCLSKDGKFSILVVMIRQ